MKIDEFLKTEDISIRKFAKKAGITAPTLTRALKGEDIRLSVAMKIERASQGRIKCQEILNEKKLK